MYIERAEARKAIVRPVYFLDKKDDSRYAFSVDLSSCGLCLITNRQISAGDTIDLFSRFFWDNPRKAVAVWTKNISDKALKIGMTLCSDQQPL